MNILLSSLVCAVDATESVAREATTTTNCGLQDCMQCHFSVNNNTTANIFAADTAGFASLLT